MKNIFISSTFIDMQAERDLVQERVLPALREEARKYGDNVGVVDLRWGIDTLELETEEGAAKVLQVCLDEIDRSHPYMLIFLGERYGTVVNEAQIRRAIRGREDKYITDDYVKSITALEVEYGALSETYGELNHCVVCFREPVAQMIDGEEKDLYIERTEYGRQKLNMLKEHMRQNLGQGDYLITYSCTWDASAGQMVDFTSNGQPLETVLINCFTEMFQEDWKKYESLRWQDKEQLTFDALMESKLRSFVGREMLLEEYYQSAISGHCPIVLQGEIGCGKTAIMCKLIERLQKEGKNVFKFFSGVGSMSTNAEYLVMQMVYYMEKLLGIEEHFGEKNEIEEINEIDGNHKIYDVGKHLSHTKDKKRQYDEWIERLRALCIQMPEGEKVYACIDALDQLFWDEHMEKLDFFVKEKGIQIIASCTDMFELPMEAIVNRTIKDIPHLSKTDAKRVAESIFASYSRNIYVAIEEAILEKECIGNPLYISLLIQRLNMMDEDELREARTEKEIITLGTGIIREMPEEIEGAIVAVIQNGIDKIGEAEDVLYEMLQYLALSRNGLRMSDLQGIFAKQEKTLPTLDMTRFMKYLDSFFYIHEEGRIDFTHKVIRQGLQEKIANREMKVKAIKEHLKSLDSMDELRMGEGMYFARITRDKKFAKELIEQAYRKREVEEVLVKAVINEAVEDGGKFYCELIDRHLTLITGECEFFLWLLPDKLGAIKEEAKVRIAIGKALIMQLEYFNEALAGTTPLFYLAIGYKNMGDVLGDLGQVEEALWYYQKMITHLEALCKTHGTSWYQKEMSMGYNKIGNILANLGKKKEASLYYKKAIKCRKLLNEKSGNEEQYYALVSYYHNMGGVLEPGEALRYYDKALRCAKRLHKKVGGDAYLEVLSACYGSMGNVLSDLEQFKEALSYYEKGLGYAEQLHEKLRSETSLENLSISYCNMGKALSNLGQMWEALPYYKKDLKYKEQLHEKVESEKSLYNLSISYANMGNVLIELGCIGEAVLYYEKDLECTQQLYEKSGNEKRLNDMIVCYVHMGNALRELGRAEEALSYHKKNLKYVEMLYEKVKNETSLNNLSITYRYMGDALIDLGRVEEALLYYKSYLKYTEDAYEQLGNEKSLRNLSIGYNNMGNVLRDLEQTEEALLYYDKMMKCMEELYRKSGNEKSLHDLSISYNNMGNVLRDLGQTEEALLYYDKMMKCMEELHEKSESERSLRDLSVSYSRMGNALSDLGQTRDALLYYEKDLKCMEELYEMSESERNMRDLSMSYNDMGNTLKELEQIDKALLYYEKALQCAEQRYNKLGSETSDNIRIQVNALKGMYLCFNKLGRRAEAEEHLPLAKEKARILYEYSGKKKDKVLLEEILGYQSNMN